MSSRRKYPKPPPPKLPKPGMRVHVKWPVTEFYGKAIASGVGLVPWVDVRKDDGSTIRVSADRVVFSARRMKKEVG